VASILSTSLLLGIPFSSSLAHPHPRKGGAHRQPIPVAYLPALDQGTYDCVILHSRGISSVSVSSADTVAILKEADCLCHGVLGEIAFSFIGRRR
jgi:hypothetical protein